MAYFINFFKVISSILFVSLFGREIYAQSVDLKANAQDNLPKDDFLKERDKQAEDIKIGQFSENSLPALLPASKVVIQGLDKITGRVFTIETHVGKSIDFGRLKIIAHRCYKAPPEEIPEAIVDVDIYEKTTSSGEEVLIFKNKMYASSPAVSALDHPVYDIWIKDCF
ncbi:MAG: DUF2155 domain-containing protein [Proteobacteria bacterium]|nr:DUF2155 domain-containing protein [Pseudomonadota bacterium]